MRRGFGFGRQRAKRGPYAPGLTPVDVIAMIGESNTVGARNVLTALPAGYYGADANSKIWDDTTTNAIATLVPGPQEQQPGGAAYLDPAYTNTVGSLGNIAKRYRARNGTKELYAFVSAQGGGRFSDLAGRGRAANYNPALSDGAFNEMKVSWNAFVAALAAAGKTPNVIACRVCLGANSAADATETSNFQSDLTNLIAQMRSQGVVLNSGTKVLIDRLGNQLTDTNGTNRPTIRAAALAIAAGDPTKVEVLDTDGVTVVGGAIDFIHWSSAGHAYMGPKIDAQAAGLWHPTKPIQAAGDAIYPVRQWQPGEANASTAQMIDLVVNGRTFTHPTAPVLNTRTLASGLVARYATWNGTSSYSLSSNEQAINRAGGFILYGAINMAAVNNAVVYSEAHDSLANQFWGLKSDAAGNACITIRDDNGVLALSLASLGAVLFNGTWKTFVLTFDGSIFTIYVNGVAGSSPQTITKGPMTLQNSTIGAQKVGGGVSGFAPLNAGEIGIMQYSTTGLAGVVANLHAYLSREWLA